MFFARDAGDTARLSRDRLGDGRCTSRGVGAAEAFRCGFGGVVQSVGWAAFGARSGDGGVEPATDVGSVAGSKRQRGTA